MHPGIIKIKSVFTSIRLFVFNFVSSDDISKILTSLDQTKKPVVLFQQSLANKEICKDLANYFNGSIKKDEFQNELKAADISPIFKKQDRLNKENYRPVSALPTISKIFERVFFDQLAKFSNKFLFPLFYGFRKEYSILYALVNLFQKCRKSLDETDRIVGTLLLDLFKGYCCVNHELIVAKLAANGLNKGSLRNLFIKKKKAGKNQFFPEQVARNYSRCPLKGQYQGLFYLTFS